jgi:hypothetical protein
VLRGIGISKIFGIGIEKCSESRDPAVGIPIPRNPSLLKKLFDAEKIILVT